MTTVPLEILSLTRSELVAAAEQRLPRGAGFAAAIHRLAHRDGSFDPEALGAAPRVAQAWREQFTLFRATIVRAHDEPDAARGVSTSKLVIRAADGLEYETVLIPIGSHKQSQCLSSQVGCAMGCRFCETARMGKWRDLSPAELVGQVVIARRERGWRPTSLVFQGMGEPLDALDSVARALRVLGDSHGLGFAQDRITICTAGHADGIRRLAALELPRLNLCVSLNVADDARRAALMPIARRYPLADLQRALIDARPRRNWQLGVHVCLMPGLNDTRADATAIAAFCRPLGRVMVHLIPYNPGTQPLTRAPSIAELERFVGWLREEGLPVRRRITKGRSVMAACGQLGNAELRRNAPQRARTEELPGQDLNLN